MKIIVLIFLVMTSSLSALENPKLKADSITFPIFIGGVTIPANFNINSGNANQLGENLYCCSGVEFSDVTIGSGIAVNFGVIFGILDSLPVLKSVTYGASASLNWFTNSYEGKSIELPRKVYSGNNTITEFYESGIVNVQSDYLKLFLSFNINSLIDSNSIKFKELDFIPSYSFGIGTIIGIQLDNYAEQFVEISNKNDYRYLDGSTKKIVSKGELTNSSSFIFGLGTAFICSWNLQQFSNKVEFDNLFISFGLGWDYYFNSLISDQNLVLNQLSLNLGLTWYFKKDLSNIIN